MVRVWASYRSAGAKLHAVFCTIAAAIGLPSKDLTRGKVLDISTVIQFKEVAGPLLLWVAIGIRWAVFGDGKVHGCLLWLACLLYK